MATIEQARNQSNPFFPDHVCTPADINPELIELFDTFALDEVLRATELLPFIGYPRTLNALRAIDEVAPPASENTSDEENQSCECVPQPSA